MFFSDCNDCPLFMHTGEEITDLKAVMGSKWFVSMCNGYNHK
jgi:hypothetical protein